MQIVIRTKSKRNVKQLNIVGDYLDNRIQICNSDQQVVHDFLRNIQKNQKLELYVDSDKVGNIKNLELHDDKLEFEAKVQTEQQDNSLDSRTSSSKTSAEKFCEKWRKFNNNVDPYDILRAVFQVDIGMFQSFNMKSEQERNQILKFAGEVVHNFTKNLQNQNKER